jgi:ribosomal protein S18
MEQRGMESRETRETGESKETSEARKLDDATFAPQEAVEQSSDFKQAEVIQANVTSAVETAQAVAAGDQAAARPRAESKQEVNPAHTADKAVGEKEVAKFSAEQKAAFEKFNPEDRAALTRLIGQSKRINPAKLKGTSGGIIY